MSIMDSAPELNVSYDGFIESTYDALILFEACIAGQIKHVSRRPQEREREHIIQSGRVFIYEENKSGIKRWTDGILWSPSRILGNFLVYRQLLKAFGPGEKKRATKKTKAGLHGAIRTVPGKDNCKQREDHFQGANSLSSNDKSYGRGDTKQLETERILVGSLTDSYDFLEDGLVKKTISVSYGEVTHHLVSYYTLSDVINHKFMIPSKDPRLAGIFPRASLLTSQNFRVAVESVNPMDRPSYPRNIHEMNRQNRLSTRITMMPELYEFSNSGMTGNRMYSITHIIPIASSTPKHGALLYHSTSGSLHHQVSHPSINSALQTSEQSRKVDKKQSDIANDPNSNYNCLSSRNGRNIKQEGTTLYRRDLHSSGGCSIPQGVGNDPNLYHDPKRFHRHPQDVTLTIESIAVQGTLLGTNQVDFDHSTAHGQKQPSGIPSGEIEIWQLGNTSVGHGHGQYL